MTNDTQQEVSLKELFAQVDDLLEQMESTDISLEEGFAAYQKGRALLRLCEEKIDLIEKKVMVLDEEGDMDEL